MSAIQHLNYQNNLALVTSPGAPDKILHKVKMKPFLQFVIFMHVQIFGSDFNKENSRTINKLISFQKMEIPKIISWWLTLRWDIKICLLSEHPEINVVVLFWKLCDRMITDGPWSVSNIWSPFPIMRQYEPVVYNWLTLIITAVKWFRSHVPSLIQIYQY